MTSYFGGQLFEGFRENIFSNLEVDVLEFTSFCLHDANFISHVANRQLFPVVRLFYSGFDWTSVQANSF